MREIKTTFEVGHSFFEPKKVCVSICGSKESIWQTQVLKPRCFLRCVRRVQAMKEASGNSARRAYTEAM